MKKTLFLLSIITLCFASCKTKKQAIGTPSDSISDYQGVAFMQSKTLGRVLDEAAAENKLVFVDFYTTWCLPCKLMDEDVFPDEGIGEFMNEHFISYKIDAEKGNGPDLRTLYEVQVYPTLLFLDTRGRVLQRKEGAAYHTELKKLAKQAIATAAQN